MGCAASTPLEKGREKEPEALPFVRRKGAAEKVVMLGDSGVGKSSIVQRLLAGDVFNPHGQPLLSPTVGTAFITKTIEVPEKSCRVKLEIWDTAGQEKFCAMAPLYYRGASAALIVYDITRPDSFNRARFWVAEMQHCGPSDIVLALVGNKADVHHLRRVPISSAKAYAESHNMFFIETSAITADNISLLFQEICKQVVTKEPRV